MVWKCDFFWWFMRLVRVPPYESWANWTNFLGSWENGKFFWGQTCCTLLHTQNEEKSQKISTCIRIHKRVYANTWWWGQICPPPALILFLFSVDEIQKHRSRSLLDFQDFEKIFSFSSQFMRFLKNNSLSLLEFQDFLEIDIFLFLISENFSPFSITIWMRNVYC